MEFMIVGEEIHFSEEFIELNKLRSKFLVLSINSRNEFAEMFKDTFYDGKVALNGGRELISEFLERYLNIATEMINELGEYKIDSMILGEQYYYNKHCKLNSEIDSVCEYFNLKLSKDQPIELEEVLEKFKDIIKKNVFNIHFAVVDVCIENKLMNIAKYSTSDEIKKSNKLFKKFITTDMSKENQQKIIDKIIKLNPYNEELYKFLLWRYGDKQNEVEKLCEVLGYYNIYKYKKELIRGLCKELVSKGDEEVTIIKDKVEKFAENLGVDDCFIGIKGLNDLLNKNNTEEEISSKRSSIDDTVILQQNESINTEEILSNSTLLVVTEDEIDNISDSEEITEKEIQEDSNDSSIFDDVEAEDEDDDEDDIDIESDTKENSKKNIKKIVIPLGAIAAIYLCVSLYSINRFSFGTTINGIKAGGKTLDEISKEVLSKAQSYILKIQGRDDVEAEIGGLDIALEYDFDNEINEIKEGQNPFLWISGLFNSEEYSLSDGVRYDETLLQETIDKLIYFNEESIVNPENAKLEYVDGSYEIIEEINGNKVNKEELYKNVVNAILNIDNTVNLEEGNCYEKPNYTSESSEVVNARDNINKCLSSVITYDISGSKEIVDSSMISNWVQVDEEFNVTVDEEKVRGYINTLGNKYDNLGNVREFTKPYGGVLKVSTSSNISYIDRHAESEALIALIKEGANTTKEPIFTSVTESNMNSYVVNTFVEIDLTKQHIWFYKNGSLMTEGDIVTGDVSRNYSTPAGVFGLTYKDKDAILRGPGYATPVTYWMPFNGDIGLHDATWRNGFGGEIYKNNGSHGCVNLTYNVAQTIFNNIEAGNIVICRY